MKLKDNIASMEAYAPGKSVPGAVKLSSNENPLGPSPAAIQAASDVLNGIHRYPDGAATALKSALSKQWDLPEEHFLVANGSDEVFALLAAAWISPGENAVSCRETFSQYRYAVHLFNAQMREVSLTHGHFDLEAIGKQIDENTRIVFLCNPNNPTGTYKNHKEIERFLTGLPSHLFVVLDEAYAEFAQAPDFPDSQSLLKQFPNLIVTRTFSKLYGLAGLRVGYAVGDPQIIQGAARAAMPFNVNNLAQAAALAALTDEAHRKATLELVECEREYMTRELEKRRLCPLPSQANFVCFSLKQPVANLWSQIADRGIVLRDLASFGLSEMARYTYGTRNNNNRLLSILDELLGLES